MAGSKKAFIYESNLVVGLYSIELDESNTEAVNGNGFDLTSSDTVIGSVSLSRKGAVEPRYIHFVGADSDGVTVVRTVPWLKASTFILASFATVIFPVYKSDGSVEQVSCRPTIVIGEKYYYGATATDNGILDGDQD